MSKQSKYETHIAPRLAEIKSWRAERISIPDIAKKLSVGLSTLNQERYRPELEEALKAPELTEKEKQKQIQNSIINHKKYFNSTLSFVRRHADASERLKIVKTLIENVEDSKEIDDIKKLVEEHKKS
ncbi:hypothetical protein LMG9449_2583 [Lactococcus lactis subsp. lactis]|uniref:Uncharacterized protein n=1 Tax=Lactococcus lactis subsp. lactis TaxID=1360 RepID=A0A0V8DLB6_LACLL|nr:hypothetical protein [Lactococcus lactis]KSU14342.1 hypothetical protein LMG9449_2583 [Lactococcus lactis subsp. lactis]